MEVSNLSFLNCDVFIKFNHHEYVETDYLKKKKKKNSCVAKDKSFGIAGTGSFQESHLPFSLSLPWASEAL